VDETSLRVERKNHWIHVCSGADITLKFRKRSFKDGLAGRGSL
jgi:hypothetical protein